MPALTSSERVRAERLGQAPNRAAAVRGSWVTEGQGAHYMYIFAVQDERISGSSARGASTSKTSRSYRMAGWREMRCRSRSSMIRETESLTGRRFVERSSASDHPHHFARGQTNQSVAVTLKRPTPNAAAILAEGRRPEGPEPFMPSGPPEPLTPEKVLGVWRAPTGPTAYLLKRVGDRILGLACDPKCEDGSYSAFI